jgi:hypothetical protein
LGVQSNYQPEVPILLYHNISVQIDQPFAKDAEVIHAFELLVYGVGSVGTPLKQRGWLLFPIISKGLLSLPSLFAQTKTGMRSLAFLRPLNLSVEKQRVPSGTARK